MHRATLPRHQGQNAGEKDEQSTRTFKIKVIETELTQTLSMSRSPELLSALSSIFANVFVGKMNKAEKHNTKDTEMEGKTTSYTNAKPK